MVYSIKNRTLLEMKHIGIEDEVNEFVSERSESTLSWLLPLKMQCRRNVRHLFLWRYMRYCEGDFHKIVRIKCYISSNIDVVWGCLRTNILLYEEHSNLC
jgi:hypothetical protein